MTDDSPLTEADALVALMIAVSASDETIRTAELLQIQNILDHLPIFADYDGAALPRVSEMVFDLLEQEDGLDALFGLVRDALPERLFETAYALACDIAAADGQIGQVEARMLEETRHELSIDRLHAAAIERGAKARYQSL
ncbi:tellurite resistance TerB family protein [Pseudoroseicyclus sp. CXY001]|uniref:tellurite resistance TerB family protein n=1 Tax=Pseudoroseicyclus sp. CXY001 TaxID=3242492 RepID=UPI0035712BAE